MSQRLLSVVVGVVMLVPVLAAGPPILAAPAVTVTVDGRVVAFDQPPTVVGGRVLIPLRGVFERLGARVAWQAEARQVIARRGSTTVVLQPGERSARVNGQTITLDVPALIAGGRTLVPLRFVGQALGVGVEWDAASRIVSVRSAPPQALPVLPSGPAPAPPPAFAPVPPPAPASAPPIQAPPPANPPIRLIQGTVVRVDTYSVPPRLYVQSGNTVWTVVATPATSIFLTEVSTGRTGSAGLDQIRRGDFVRVTEYPPGQATEIRGSYRELAGRLDGVTGRFLYLAGGQTFQLAGEPLIILDGREVGRDLLQQGMEVILRINPQTNEVWEVRALPVIGPPPPIRQGVPRIDRAWLNTTGPLGIGATLVVTMQGTPDGRAWFDIDRVEDGIRMEERPSGRYVGRYTVRPGDAVRRGTVTVRLRVRGAESARDAGDVTIDGIPPEFTRRVPEPNAIVRTARPAIIVGITDRGPAGIKAGTLRVWVNGEEARMTAASDAIASFDPPEPLSSGRVRVQARVSDMAGNEASTSWTFTVDLPAPTPIPTFVPPNPPPPGVIKPTPPGPVAAPIITSPRPGDTITSPLVIRGTGTGGYRVQVTVDYQVQGRSEQATIGPITAVVTGGGTWEVRVPLPSPIAESGRITITAVSVAPWGGRSDPVRTVFTWSYRELERP